MKNRSLTFLETIMAVILALQINDWIKEHKTEFFNFYILFLTGYLVYVIYKVFWLERDN